MTEHEFLEKFRSGDKIFDEGDNYLGIVLLTNDTLGKFVYINEDLEFEICEIDNQEWVTKSEIDEIEAIEKDTMEKDIMENIGFIENPKSCKNCKLKLSNEQIRYVYKTNRYGKIYKSDDFIKI